MEAYVAVVVAFLIANYIKVIIGYVGAGLIYTFLKWTLSLIRLRRKVLSIDAEMIASRKTSAVYKSYTDEEVVNVLRAGMASKIFSDSSYPPRAKENIGLITAWALFWPINLVWTMFADVLTEVWNWLATKFVGVYQAIANGILPK